MSNLALTKEGKAVLAEGYSESEWKDLKSGYVPGDILMPCCMSPAIPKTSPNYVQFFAHHSDECETSPESIWHLKAKEDVCAVLKAKGIDVKLEYSGDSPNGRWQADVYFESNGRRIAIEIQKSYQQLDKYLDRQTRYRNSGVESYWLLYQPRYITLIKSLAKHRLKKEFGGKFPSEGYIHPCLPELPIAYYETDEDGAFVKGAAFFKCSLEEWVDSILAARFSCVDNVWKIV